MILHTDVLIINGGGGGKSHLFTSKHRHISLVP